MAEYKDNHDSVGIQITTSKLNENSLVGTIFKSVP